MQNLPKDFFTPEAAKKRGPERHLTKNYNFAGPGTEYFARMKGSGFYEKLMKDAGRPLVGTKPYNKAYDKLDGCGRVHDKVFADPKATSAQVRAADREFQKCAQGVKLSEGLTDKLRSVASRVGFEGKIAAEKAGVLRGGSFASGGEDKGKHGSGEIGSQLGKKGAVLVSLGKKAIAIAQKGVKLVDK
jgi:hypothetical protein